MVQARSLYARSALSPCTNICMPCAADARSWVDSRFVHVLTPNIYRTLAEAMQTFDYITKTGNFSFVDREVARWSGVAIMVREFLLAPCPVVHRMMTCVHTTF